MLRRVLYFMIEIKKPRIECIETPTDSSYGKYVVEPLERGYGTTLGNSLRRVLLSSLPGTACTSIKIAGIQHEWHDRLGFLPTVFLDGRCCVWNAMEGREDL